MSETRSPARWPTPEMVSPAFERAPGPVDVRRGSDLVAPTQAQLEAVRALVADAGEDARVTWDHRFGTPRLMR
jgi:extracellular elastinolytic metalloproteinase